MNEKPKMDILVAISAILSNITANLFEFLYEDPAASYAEDGTVSRTNIEDVLIDDQDFSELFHNVNAVIDETELLVVDRPKFKIVNGVKIPADWGMKDW